ncbi:MAG TPA: GGDEF domain-containing protein [Rheinheimera sp.]|nr:GGDEF domain-containing protein [Rheinheimera sp.]
MKRLSLASKDMQPQKVRSQRRSLSVVLTLTQAGMLLLFLIMMLLAFQQLMAYQKVLTSMVSSSLPEVISSSHNLAQVNELGAQAESLSQASNDVIRRLTFQRLSAQLAELLAATGSNTAYQHAQLLTLQQELHDLNALTEQKLALQHRLSTKRQKLNRLHDRVLLPMQQQNLPGYTAWALQFSKIVVLANQVAASERLQDMRRAAMLLQQLFGEEQKLINALPEQVMLQGQELSTELFALLLDEQGLLALKSELLRVNSRSNGRANFVRNLVQHYAHITEYDTDELNGRTLQQSQQAITQLQHRIYILALVSALMLAVVVGIIWFIQRRVSGRLTQLNRNVLAQLHGDAISETIQGNDEIADISQSFQYFADKVALQTQQLEQLSFTDSLTGLANRRAADQRLQHEFAVAQRQRHALAVLMLDVDYFKAFNDSYGHQSGDDGLKWLSDILTECVKREQDMVARFGGEEFICILPDTDVKGAEATAKQIIFRLQQAAIPHRQSKAAPYLTVSIGVLAGVPDDKLSLRDWLAKADEALYTAKEQGRNRYHLAACHQ